jgi:Ca2+-binding RTX toxin-like protein
VVYNLLGDLDRTAPGGMRTITGDLGAGNDRFSATIDGELNMAAVKIAVNGAAGADSLSTLVTADLALSASLSINLRGGLGQDTITMRSLADVAIGSSLSLNLQGNQGNDRITMNLMGDISGALHSFLDGGQARDVISAGISLDLSLSNSLPTPPVPMPGC